MLQSFTAQRDGLAAQMKAILSAATFAGQRLDEQQAKQLINEAENLLAQVRHVAQP